MVIWESTPSVNDNIVWGTYQAPCIKSGSTVRLNTGTKPLEVISIDWVKQTAECRYLTSRKITTYPISRLVSYETTLEVSMSKESFNNSKQENEMNKLYKTTEGRYGEYKGIDGDKILLKMSDTNGYEAFASDAIERVMPYTFDVMFAGEGRVYSYLGKEGVVKEGDILITNTGKFVTVKAVDTKSESATKTFTGRIVVTKELG